MTTAPFIRKESSPFLKRVLIPFWVLRMLVLVIALGVYGLTLASLIVYSGDIEDAARKEGIKVPLDAAKGLAGVILALILICLGLEITCIVKRSRRTLSPKFFLIVNVVQTTLTLVLFILTMIGQKVPGVIGVAVVMFLFFIGFLIYASVIFHQFRKGRLSSDVEHVHQPVPMSNY